MATHIPYPIRADGSAGVIESSPLLENEERNRDMALCDIRLIDLGKRDVIKANLQGKGDKRTPPCRMICIDSAR